MNSENKYPAFEDTGKMRKKTKVIMILAVVLAVLWVACISVILIYSLANGYVSEEPDDETENTEEEVKNYTVDDFEYQIQIDETMKNAINSNSADYLVLINKKNPVGANYTVSNLKTIDSKYTKTQQKLEMNAAIAAETLMAEMRARGFDEIIITSSYRSYDRQKQLFDGYIAQEKAKNPNLSDDQIKAIVLGYSAEPGYSEHHTGLVIDFYLPNQMIDLVNFGSETPASSTDIGFAESAEYQWLLKNAHKFGFILRYPEDKVSQTGYNYESWHFRFVGVDAATKIYEKNITLEAYLD